jgi:hypothetical protein
MSYNLLPFRQTPNYTPASQTRAFYGRPRTIEFGAGHWWDDPSVNPSFNGVVNTLMNPARQASAQAVVGDGIVQELVRAEDTSWATGSANPYTVSIETDPQIYVGGAKAERIMATLAEYIADKGWHNLTWRPHKYWMQTGCNPIDWGEVMRRAKDTWQNKYGTPSTPTPPPAQNANIEWVQFPSPVQYIANKQPTKLWNFNQTDWAGFGNGVKDFNKGDQIVIFGKGINKNLNREYLVTQYSFEKRIANGFSTADLDVYVAPAPTPTVPEWQRNLKDITPVKLMVLVAQTPIVNLNDLSIIKQLGQGTYIDFTKSTTVAGVEYLISSYSATQAMPNGIKRADVGVPAEPPASEKPEWLENWEDIADVKMYARADTDLVNLEDGSTIKVIPRGTEIAVASTTEWHGHKYAITEYSTAKKEGRGIRLDDLDMKPVGDDTPVNPSPDQPTIDENVNWLVKAVKAILAFFGIKLS